MTEKEISGIEVKGSGKPGAQEMSDKPMDQLLQTFVLAMSGNQDALKAISGMGLDGVKGIFIDDLSNPESIDVKREGDDVANA